MSQKTAIQELIEYFEQQLRLQRSCEIKYTTEEALVDAIDVCKNAINTKEKEQILGAYKKGYEQRVIDQLQGSYPFILKTTCKGDAYIEKMTENSPIMQFTGFRCKKKEVYDGDIIKHPKATEPEEKGWVVVWKDFGWKLKCVNLVNDEELFTEFSDYFANDCDVIGNIYENLELLS